VTERLIRQKQWLLLGLVLIAFAAAFMKALNRPTPVAFQLPAIAAQADAGPVLRTGFVSTQAGPHRHASSLVELRDGRLRAFWFSGSREGAQDVEIRSSVFDPKNGKWSGEQTVIDRMRAQRALWRYVKKLGNPVIERSANGSLSLYYVTVSLGGWAGSSITSMTSTDDGETWGPPRRLVTSPFINISTLVKGTPFHYADGTIGLPVYHEFLGKFGEILRVDGAGKVLDKQRLSHGSQALQPVVLVQNGGHAEVLMRHGNGGLSRVIGSSTADAGQHWTLPKNTSLLNPNSAVSGVVMPGGQLLVALNDIESNRDALSLVVSTDGGQNWQTLYVLEDQRGFNARSPDRAEYSTVVKALALATSPGLMDTTAVALSSERMCVGQRCSFEFSYPYMIQTERGDVHLVYTWNRSFIKHVEFSRAWLEQRLKETSNDQLH
jgi:predicted neuraminidase